MLTVDEVCKYIQRTLGTPLVSLELTNDMLLPYIQEDALSHFESYIPDVNRIVLDTSETSKDRVRNNIKNLFWVKDPECRQVSMITDVNEDKMVHLAFGEPYIMPITGVDSVIDYAMAINSADIARYYSSSHLTWYQEKHLPQVWIFSEDSLSHYFSVEYTRSHDPSLSTIPQEFKKLFKDLCLAYVMRSIGEIRTKYGTLNTPVGDIQIDGGLRERGESLLNKCDEELQKKATIFTHVDVDF